jgi:hypothetical protein
MKSCRRALSQEGPHCLASVRGQAIPDDEELARNPTQEMLQEADDALPIEGLALLLRDDLTGFGERPDDRKVVPGELAAQGRRLPAGSVGPNNAGQQIESALVYPDDRPSLAASPFLRAGQRSRRQRSMATSLR